MLYNVGDRVLIQSQRTGGMASMGGMDCWLGKEMTISRVLGDGDYKMEEDGGLWFWTDRMIIGLVSECGTATPVEHVYCDDCVEFVGVQETPIKMECMSEEDFKSLKAGDLVTVRADLQVEETYGSVYVAGLMLKYAGQELCVANNFTAYSYDYTIKLEGSNWSWTREMLSPLVPKVYTNEEIDKLMVKRVTLNHNRLKQLLAVEGLSDKNRNAIAKEIERRSMRMSVKDYYKKKA